MIERLNRLMNVSSREWPRILVAWSMMFLARFGFVVGWTLMLSIFLTRIGIEALPFLFLVNALLVITGSLIYRNLMKNVKREVLISFTVIFAAALLLSSLFFLNSNTFLFFAFLLTAVSVFLAQLNILLSLFNEELFSPLESQRTFPLIESAETLGGILGGLTLTLFAETLPSFKFIIIWILTTLLILPIVLKFNQNTMEIPKTKLEHITENPRTLGSSFGKILKTPFLKGLLVVVLLQWALLNLIEFQYTSALEDTISMVEGATLESQMHLLMEKLGTLQLVFSAGALFIQLVLASRILVSLGITSTLLVHPVVTLFNLLGLFFRFSFFTSAITRGSFELTQLIFKNAYDSSYYAIPHEDRSEVKEIMQGLIKPLGALLGTFFILVVVVAPENYQILVQNILLLISTLCMMVFILKLTKRYTTMSEQNLSRKFDLGTRVNAAEILGQNGHDRLSPALEKILNRENEPALLKEKILESFGLRENLESIDLILKNMAHQHPEIRKAAVHALGHFTDLKKAKMSHSFTRHLVLSTLKKSIENEEVDAIREQMVQCFFALSPHDVIPFLIDSIQKNSTYEASFIRMMKLFHDPHLKSFLSPHLKSKSPEIRSAAIVALWQFKNIRNELKHYLNQMLESSKKEILLQGIQTSGEVQYNQVKIKIQTWLHHEDPEIRHAATLSLALMEEDHVIPLMVHFLINEGHEWYDKTRYVAQKLPRKFRHKVEAAVHSHWVGKIHELLREAEVDLHKLKDLFQKIEAHDEVHKIEKVLASVSLEKI